MYANSVGTGTTWPVDSVHVSPTKNPWSVKSYFQNTVMVKRRMISKCDSGTNAKFVVTRGTSDGKVGIVYQCQCPVREFERTGEFPSQRPVTRSFDVFFDLHLNKRLDKQLGRRWIGDAITLIMTSI